MNIQLLRAMGGLGGGGENILYIDTINGKDYNDGSLISPLKTLAYAATLDGDIKILSTDIIRTQFFESPILTINKNTKIEGGLLNGGVDLSQNTPHHCMQANMDFNAWGETLPLGWAPDTTTGTVSKIQGETGYAVKLNSVAGSVSIKTKMYLQSSTQYTLTFRFWAENISNDIKITISHVNEGNKYLQQDGVTWSSTGAQLHFDVVAGETGAWKTKTFTFTSDSNTTSAYSLVIYGDGGSGTISYTDISLTTDYLFNWTNTVGNTYSLTVNDGRGLVKSLCKSTTWGIDGQSSIMRIKEDKLTPTTPASGLYGVSGNTVYYTLIEGENISSLHLEANFYNSIGIQSILINAGTAILKNIDIAGGTYCINVKNAAICNIENINTRCGQIYNIYSQNTSFVNINKATSHGCKAGDGVTITDASSCRIFKLKTFDNYDDGFNSNTSGSTFLAYCLAYDNTDKDNSTAGYEFQGDGDVTIYNSTAVGNIVGFQIVNTGNKVFKNNLAYNNQIFGFNAANSDQLEADYNAWYLNDNNTTFNTAHGDNKITSDPLLDSDFELTAGSPCINTGINVGLTTDLNDNPVIGIPDIGAYEYQD